MTWAPDHFTRCPGVISRSTQTHSWIVNNTRGRFAFHRAVEQGPPLLSRDALSFEDPQEAMLFTLWYQQKYFNDF